MGNFLSTLSETLFCPANKKILLLGLDNAGKAVIYYHLNATDSPDSQSEKQRRNWSVTIRDVGGGPGARANPHWEEMFSGASGAIFVVDCNEHGRFDEAKDEFDHLMSSATLAGVPFVVFANKQDLAGAVPPAEIEQLFSLNDNEAVKRRRCTIFGTSSVKRTGLIDGYNWLQTAMDSTD